MKKFLFLFALSLLACSSPEEPSVAPPQHRVFYDKLTNHGTDKNPVMYIDSDLFSGVAFDFGEFDATSNQIRQSMFEFIDSSIVSMNDTIITSNDIDVLITKKGNIDNDTNYLKSFVKKLKKDMKLNKNKPLIIDDMTDKNIETKYMGFIKYKNNPVRRIDIRFVPYESYNYALLYFTGSKDLNKKMRQIDKNKGYTLSEYELVNKKGKQFIAKSEKDIFKKLGMEYLPPKLR